MTFTAAELYLISKAFALIKLKFPKEYYHLTFHECTST